jgi:putative membrane protein insertion efficiency factor
MTTTTPELSTGRLGAGQRVLLGGIRAYQALRTGRTSMCRFYPSCSVYAAEAVERHGAWRGGLLALRRIGRCRPRGGHGVDLVPEAAHRHELPGQRGAR